jgi:hypothetical protein
MLYAAFRSYANALCVAVENRRAHRRTEEQTALSLSNYEVKILRDLVDALEQTHQFSQLVMHTVASFPNRFRPSRDDKDLTLVNITNATYAIRNFFRRSGYDIEAFKREDINLYDMFDTYERAFQTQRCEDTYLALLDVEFKAQHMDFGDFQIRLFLPDELSTILRNDMNAVFYPESVVDTKRLIGWFLYCPERPTRPISKALSPLSADEIEDRVLIQGEIIGIPKPTKFPFPIEQALQQLTLYHWDWELHRTSTEIGDRLREGWVPFHILCVITQSDDLLRSPPGAPDLSDLNDSDPIVDPQTGREIGEMPNPSIILDSEETEPFVNFVRHIADLQKTLELHEHGWDFLGIARHYVIKAFFADNFMDELLWHIIAIEALRGKNEERATEQLARRTALILGRTEQQRKQVRQQFRELYDFRSDLVHGQRFKKSIYQGHRRRAREFARCAIIWFLHYLSHIQGTIPSSQNIPTREDFIDYLDQAETAHLSKWKQDLLQHPSNPTRLMDVPSGFPHVQDWIQWIE